MTQEDRKEDIRVHLSTQKMTLSDLSVIIRVTRQYVQTILARMEEDGDVKSKKTKGGPLVWWPQRKDS